jgi:hypothetical protein
MLATEYAPKSLTLQLTNIRDSHFQTQRISKFYVIGASVCDRGLHILLLPELHVAQSSGQGHYFLGIPFSSCGGSLHPQTFLLVKVSDPTAQGARKKQKQKNSTHLHSHQRIHTAITKFRPTARSNQKTVYINNSKMRNVPYAESS